MSVTIKGAENVKSNILKQSEKYQKAAAKSINIEGGLLLAASQRLCPVATGRLRASAYLKPAEPEEKPKARIGYGAEYALAVHERIEVHHADGTQAKFMSTPIDAAKASFKEKVAARIKEEVEK